MCVKSYSKPKAGRFFWDTVCEAKCAVTRFLTCRLIVDRANSCRPSVCLSSVMLVHPTQVVVIFGNFSTAFGTLTIR